MSAPPPTRSAAALLAVLLTGTFMTSLDVTIVNVAVPSIQHDLGGSGAVLQLVVNGYSVALAALLVLGARLGDDRGHRRLFLAGLAGFTAASAACGVAAGPGMLVAARVLQGISAAALVPQVLTIIQLRFEGAARTRALGLQASVIALGAVVGQLVGGALIDADLAGAGWRPVFLVNVPVGLAVLAAGMVVLPRTHGARRRLDVAGAVLLTGGVVLAMVPLCFGRQAGWAWWTWACLAAAAALAVALVGHLRRHPEPLADLRLMGRRPVGLGLGSIALQMVAYGGFLFTLTLHLQGQLGFSPLRAGLTFGPYALGFAVTSLGCAGLRPAVARRVGPAALALAAAGYVVLGLAAAGGSWRDELALPLLAVTGAGFGAGWSAVIGRMMGEVPAAHAQDASGLLTTTVQLCFAVGVATIGSVFLGDAADGSAGAFAVAAVACGALALDAALVAALQWRRPRGAAAGDAAVAAASSLRAGA
ncbi:MAG TPA: MFS transporter [Baekduia sp.]|nr:MFS transporter [Baekduia sp.]